MSGDYVRQRLAEAIEALSASAAPIQQRVANAGSALAHLQPEDFDGPEQQGLYVRIMAALHTREDVAEGSIAASAAALDDQAAAAVAKQIVELHGEVFPL